ncbi:type II toxin-antitoxin system RelB/DinJ family antitoxin [Neisseria chenwenguii]|uniref:Type II toxin-antitoxin system antitoxin, RelB/DinJ family n=1 Tax=Neisseria chenwenguii TaxID=1853278 RepID=A0A220S2D5_9NEIS|nr:type II toxin-antitoxin system RelB/DinJ family antitoxin [Neisseria chenwenguii]ASK27345.1 type II toxin-antitoxin system antitoxin, RelB/DinJ family [Neisseria chenwenguii]ROV56982.1 type II toxin-antitoxin system RelB/DinJ family antitoxin [Neisseria chenwenguii]
MGYTNFNMRLDDNLRSRAYPVLEQYGLTPSQAVRMFFNQIGQTGKVPLSFDWTEESKFNAQAEALLRESVAEMENGRYTVHSADGLAGGLMDIADE